MSNATWVHISFLILATTLEVLANIFLKYSNGFQKKWLGVLSILFVLGAFTALAQAVKGIDLSIAYALWGGFGILATAMMGAVLFKQSLEIKAWLGMLILISGMMLLKLT